MNNTFPFPFLSPKFTSIHSNMSLAKVLGVSTLKGKDGDVDVASIEGKTLLIYFSAHWCPPCRQFTPVLAKFYKDLKAKRQDFELVFASSDKDEKSFDEYYNEHPWLALPFSERKAKDKLSRKFKVQGIPSLVAIDKDGNTITTNARDNVMRDPEGAKFPWQPRSILEVLGSTTITNKDGKKLTADDLKALDAFALYFSAHWCPPCRAFTPRLVSTYNQLKRKNVNTEFIFVSSDREESEFKEYYNEMPWATLPFKDGAVAELKELCGVQGIPTLCTFKGDGTVINKDARGGAGEDAEGDKFPWAPVELGAVNPFTPADEVVEALNSEICVILAVNDAPNKDTPIVEFTNAGKKFDTDVNKASDDEDPVRFFICDSAAGQDLFGRVLQAVNATPGAAGKPYVLAINLQNNRAKEILNGEVSADAVYEFASTFRKAQQ